MEISERDLRHLAADVDDRHRKGMETVDEDLAELHLGEGRHLMGATRRRFVRGLGFGSVSLAIGGALLPLSSLWSPAFAAPGPSPAGIPSADVALAKFAESVELAAVAGYGAAAKTGKLTPAVLAVAELFAHHHQAHAASFGALGGDSSVAKPNPKLLTTLSSEITAATGQADLLKLAYGLENAAASTYLYALGALTDPKALQATASILPVESQHAVVWGHVIGETFGDQGTYMPAFLGVNAAVQPAQYPITPGT